jgi:amino-acid N-acetyltransferase
MTADNDSQFIRWFRGAAPYINAHRGQVFVVQFGGELVASDAFTAFIHDVVLLDALGIKLVLVHGARPQVDERIVRQGGTPEFANGRRVTSEATLTLVKEAVGLVRFEVESRLSMGMANSPMAGAQIRVNSGNFVTARPVGVRDGVDFGYSAEVRKVDSQAIAACAANDQIVLLSPVGYSPTGEMFNMSSEEVATAAAVAIGATKLVMVADARTDESLPRQLTLVEAKAALITLHQQRGETAPTSAQQLAGAVHACRNGVRRAHILDGAIDGALLQELFTRDGVGTMVSADVYDETRVATVEDVAGIVELISPLEADGVLVRRSRDKLENEVGRFTVMERDGAVVACAALYPVNGTDLAELACLAVHPLYRSRERGDALLAQIEARARAADATQLFVLTTHTAQWFVERGFANVSVDALPVERRDMYNYQRNSKVLIKSL